MDKNKIKENTSYYMVCYNSGLGFKGHSFNVNNYEIIKGEFINLEKNNDFQSENKGIMTLFDSTEVFDNDIQAKAFTYKIVHNLIKKKTIEDLQKDEFLDLPIFPNFKLKSTSNPLRFGERNLCSVIQTNTASNVINEQKIIQLLAVTKEDISMLAGILNLNLYINDYAKKLLGKYAIIELNSLYLLLNGSKDQKGLKDFNNEYKNNELIKLNSDTFRLENKYGFRNIRNNIAAHKSASLDMVEYINIWKNITGDAIMEYYNLFLDHLDQILTKYYPNEKSIYFVMANQEINGFSSERIENDYKPFHGFEM